MLFQKLFKTWICRDIDKQLIPDISISNNLNLKIFTKNFPVSLAIDWQCRTQHTKKYYGLQAVIQLCD